MSTGEITIIDLLAKSGLVPSKSEARRAIDQGGVEIDGRKVSDIKLKFTKEQLCGDGVILKKGKKSFNRVYTE